MNYGERNEDSKEANPKDLRQALRRGAGYQRLEDG